MAAQQQNSGDENGRGPTIYLKSKKNVIRTPMANILRMTEEIKRNHPHRVKVYSPPNFVHPFADPKLLTKLKNDRRTRAYLNDSKFIALMKELKETPEIFDTKCMDFRYYMHISVTLRVLIFGKDGYLSADKKPAPPTEIGILPSDAAEIWQRILLKMESDRINEALSEIIAGGEAFTVQNFDQALKHYGNATRVFPHEISAYSNIGLVYHMTGRFDECIRVSLEAVKVGRENSVSSSLIAKPLIRVGKSYRDLGDYKSAKKYYEKALAEDGSKPLIASLLEEIEELINADECNKGGKKSEVMETNFKDRAFDLLRKSKYKMAIEPFTKAIENDSEEDIALYCGRAECFFELGDLESSSNDTTKCLNLDPKYVKAWILKCQIFQRLSSLAFEEAKKLDPSVIDPTGADQSLAALMCRINAIDLDKIIIFLHKSK
ncbi:unnamed protein product [Orchesella dallaii]|uniref:Uncharacterized protein n=1 Tax=Orchesella dallaii TaxID=48710 RepID=A0ABP1S6C3_9HEXA